MICRYKGNWIRINERKWKEATAKQKWKVIKDYIVTQAEYLLQSVSQLSGIVKNYWIGYVDVRPRKIYCGNIGETSLYTVESVSIACGRFGKGHLLSGIDKTTAKQIVDEWENANKRKYELNLDHGDAGFHAFQSCTFSKKQKDMLMKQLKPLLDTEWLSVES